MSDAERQIECSEHGKREATFVCQHSPKGEGLGFHQGFGADDPDALFPDAWCDACEAIRQEEGGWNARSESVAAIKVLCSGCYLKRRLLNWPRSTHVEEAELIRESVDHLRSKQDALAREYRLNDHEQYNWNQESGQLVFSNRGTPAVVADFQFVGSVSTRTGTWLWSWANESDLEAVRSQVREVRAYGEQHRLLKLACAYWSAEEEDGWAMTAVAAYLLKARGAYRSPDDHKFSFMIMTNVRWAQ
jgi:hypothetical protein